MVKKLNKGEIPDAVAGLSGWSLTGDNQAIYKSFVFGNFVAAFAFMTRVAMYAERADNHPDWSNVHNRVDVRLTSPGCKELSERDIDLARKIDDTAETALGVQLHNPAK